MKLDQVKRATANIVKGRYMVAEWERPVKQLAAYKGFPLFKRTRMVVQSYDYNNSAKVIADREAGILPAIPQPPSGMHYIAEFHPFILKANESDQHYVRMFGDNCAKATVEYIVRTDDQNSTYTKAEAMEKFGHQMQASEKRPRNKYGCFSLKIEALIEYGATTAEAEEIELTDEEAAAVHALD